MVPQYHLSCSVTSLYSYKILPRLEPFDLWKRRFGDVSNGILRLEGWHYLVADLFKGHLGGWRSILGCDEPVSHLILQPKLLNCVRPYVDLHCLRSFLVSSRPDNQ